MGLNGAKWCQIVPNRVKQGQTGSNGAKKGLTEPNGAKREKQGQMRPNGVKLHARIFYEIEKSCLATQAPRQKLAELWGFC